jgi:hypothetical protein
LDLESVVSLDDGSFSESSRPLQAQDLGVETGDRFLIRDAEPPVVQAGEGVKVAPELQGAALPLEKDELSPQGSGREGRKGDQEPEDGTARSPRPGSP